MSYINKDNDDVNPSIASLYFKLAAKFRNKDITKD